MQIVRKEQIKVGQTIWSAYDDRPFDGYGWCKGIVTDIFDDHYLFDDIDNEIEHVWGDYDTNCSVGNFTTEEDCLNWLGLGR